MKSTWHRAASAAYAALLVAAAAAIAARIGGGVEPGVVSLVDSSLDPALRAAAASAAGNASVVVEGADWAAVARGAAVVREMFGAEPPEGGFLSGIRGKTAGLLDATARSLIISNDFAAVREMAEARLFGIAPPLFSVRDDPMLLAAAYIEGLNGAAAPGWTFRDGMPAKSADGREYALVQLRAAGRAGALSPRQVSAAMDELPGRMPHGVVAHFSGAMFHSARSAGRAEREIGVLSAASLALAAILGWMLFRSLSFALPLAAALGAGAVAAAGALFAVHPRPHLLTFVFGTSLIGLSVDYVYHALAARGARTVLRPLTQSFATTAVCFAPLLLADVLALRQMALFAMAGLAAVYAGVALFCVRTGDGAKRFAESEGDGAAGGRRGSPAMSATARTLRRALFAAAASGIVFVRTSSDPSVFYRPEPSLAADERIVARLLSRDGSKIAFTPGATLQEALEREEEAGVEGGLSRLVPSLKRQRENAALIERLYAAEGAEYEKNTGIKAHGGEAGLLDPETLPPDSPLGMAVGAMWTGRGLIATCGDAVRRKGLTRVIDLRGAVQDVFERAADSAWRLFAVSSVALLAFLALMFRRRALSFVAPPAAALAATAGMLGWTGVPFTFFTLLGFFVVLGLGLDYSIFHRGAGRSARRTVLFAFLTSLAGLGLLAFTSFPVTRDLGVVFAFGLFFSYLASMRI